MLLVGLLQRSTLGRFYDTVEALQTHAVERWLLAMNGAN